VIYTYYDYLDLAPGASQARVDSAYAAVLERFRYGVTETDQELSDRVRMLHTAYGVLSDPEQRRRYDEQLACDAAQADAELKLALDAQPVAGMPAFIQNAPAASRQGAASLTA
jgi:DnaJ-class molecular chaperone